MKPQLIKVKTVNKMLFIKGRLVRTPLEAIIKSEEELNLLKSSMIHQNIDFNIELYNPEKPKKIIKKKETLLKQKDIETKKKNPTTILDKIKASE